MSLRILHVFDHSLPLHSGYTFRSLEILREQRARGWETLHLTTPKQGRCTMEDEDVDGWLFHRTPNTGDEGLLAQMRLTAARMRQIVRSARPDVIHAHSPVLNALPSLWVGRRTGVPVVYEMRSSWEDAAVDHGTTTEGSLRYRLSRAIESFALRRANQITTICEGLRSDIRSRGIPDDRVTVIPNAVDVAAFAFGAPPDPELRRTLGLAGHVVFTGRVPQADVQRYYNLIDVLAYPRLSMRLTELVTPLKPLEAMAQGRMFVASDVGGHRELVRDGVTGFLFPAGDAAALEAALEAMLARHEQWPQIRAQARSFVESERTWSNSVARYDDVYRRALGRTGQFVAAAS